LNFLINHINLFNLALVMDFVRREKLPVAVLVVGCICGATFIISGFMLLIGVLKVYLVFGLFKYLMTLFCMQGFRCLVCSSIVFCGIGIFFLQWLIIPLGEFCILKHICNVYIYFSVPQHFILFSLSLCTTIIKWICLLMIAIECRDAFHKYNKIIYTIIWYCIYSLCSLDEIKYSYPRSPFIYRVPKFESRKTAGSQTRIYDRNWISWH